MCKYGKDNNKSGLCWANIDYDTFGFCWASMDNDNDILGLSRAKRIGLRYGEGGFPWTRRRRGGGGKQIIWGSPLPQSTATTRHQHLREMANRLDKGRDDKKSYVCNQYGIYCCCRVL